MERVGGASNKSILLLANISKYAGGDHWRGRSEIGDVVLFAAIVVLMLLCWER